MDGTTRSRALRQNMSDAERKLWARLRNRGLADLKFRRQVKLGPYYPDFLCHEMRLIVEVDGGQHSKEVDAKRTAFLEAEGYRVIRFWNHDVLGNLDGVLEAIALEADPSKPSSNSD